MNERTQLLLAHVACIATIAVCFWLSVTVLKGQPELGRILVDAGVLLWGKLCFKPVSAVVDNIIMKLTPEQVQRVMSSHPPPMPATLQPHWETVRLPAPLVDTVRQRASGIELGKRRPAPAIVDRVRAAPDPNKFRPDWPGAVPPPLGAINRGRTPLILGAIDRLERLMATRCYCGSPCTVVEQSLHGSGCSWVLRCAGNEKHRPINWTFDDDGAQ